ncbi:hypothetical protein [Glaciimonas immobilis]|uniref:Uncharacterized protein n=1 Tax=Glaciimonas immobilis TaxID=728004 RepID=A0A840RWF4_9BURK|nr:hypothetical protein [Glaciimonas immobilis]KAF3996619.1 hypothetical protein HAV38_18490 [Glaciimonas immobilis]MBB5201004.1 hypothetical protein [Glaciimonas immobilis]
MLDKKVTLLSIAVALALTACGGGGSSTTPTPTPVASTGSGKAVDGYLSSATVLCDTNKNGAADTGEVSVLTDSQGNFVFSPACTGNIVVTGGTNIDTGLPFTGTLKASAGSTVATPLTTLTVDAGLTTAQVVVFLGLPAGTDVTKLDPVASTPDVLKRTLALQQIIQSTTNTLAALGKNSSGATLQGIYLEVVKSVASTLVVNPTAILIDSSGNISPVLVSSVVQQSVTNVATTANPALAASKSVIATLSPARVATVASAAIVSQAQTLATSTTSNLLSVTTAAQSDVTIANALNALSSLLVTTSTVDVSGVGTALTSLVAANTSGSTAASKTAAANALNTQASNAGATIDSSKFIAPTNYLGVVNDQIAINGSTYTLDQFSQGAVVTTAKNASLDIFSFSALVVGTPIPPTGGVNTTTVKFGLELSDTVASKRSLQVVIDGVTLSNDANGLLSVAVPASAKVYVYGATSSGTTANLTLTNLSPNLIAVGANNAITFNMGQLFNKIATDNQNPVLANLQYLKGTLNVKFVMSTLDIRTSKGLAAGLSVLVNGAGMPAVSGEGFQGVVTIQ